MMVRKYYIPDETAQKAAREAVRHVEKYTGAEVLPDVKGLLCKNIAGILKRLELKGVWLTDESLQKQHDIIRGLAVAERKRPKYKRRILNRSKGKS